MSSELDCHRVGINCRTISTLLAEKEKDNSIEITSLTEDTNVTTKRHYTCTVNRLQATGKRSGKNDYRKNLIVKMEPDVSKDSGRKRMDIYGSRIAMKNEIIAYNTILPVLAEQAEKLKCPDLPFPEFLEVGPSQRYVLLEDLSEKHFMKLEDSVKSLDPENVTHVLRALGRFHGVSLTLPKERLEKLTEGVQEVLFESNRTVLRASQIGYIKFAIKFLLEESVKEEKEAIAVLENLAENCHEMVKTLLSTKVDKAVINHGDFWMDNFLFQGDKVRFVDLQSVRCGSVGADLAYLIYVNVLPASFKGRDDEILKPYLEELHLVLTKANISVAPYTLQWVKDEIKKYEEYAMIRAIWIVPFFYMDNIKVSDETIVEDMYSDINKINENTKQEARNRMKDIIMFHMQRRSS